jgi:cyclopropane-fatty-acyl-phospholipid synthase
MAAKEKVTQIAALADIQVNGTRPWDVQVKNDEFYQRLLSQGSMGFGESYMDGWWESQQLDETFAKIHSGQLHKKVRALPIIFLALKGKVLNMQTKSKSKKVAEDHYDLGNDLYELMLDKNMQYTCAYWKDAKNLEQAQINKLHMICKKLQLKKGMTVLELGGGFGGLARFMAKEYGCTVVSYNISKEQVKYGREFCKGLNVRFEEKDYRESVNEPEMFDRVVSIGLCEHIGYKNYKQFLETAHAKLKDGGLFLLHTIGGNISLTSTDPWIDKYIFPNGMLPSVAQLGDAYEGLFVMEDWHNFGPDYDKTCMAWWENFNKGYVKLKEKNPRYDERFYRMWHFYLAASAGGFRARNLQLWQIVFSKGRKERYDTVR